MNRRQFARMGAIAVSAASYSRILGANDRVGLALIGSGRRGTQVMAAFLEDGHVDLRSICDVYDVHRNKAAKLLGKGSQIKEVVAHEEALALKDVDAVLIATPDHLHVDIATAALAAGKHVYLEKPVIHEWKERIALEDALRKSGKILQCGTQQRSGAHYLRVKEEFFDTKKLGQIVFVRAIWSNFPWQQRHIKTSPKPEGLDWKRFLGSAPDVPWETARYDSWRYYPDYGGGLLADILTHWADVAQWMLNDAQPQAASALGGIYAERDGRQNPDTVNAIVQYRNWNLSFESSVLSVRNDRPSVYFEGTEGSLDLTRDGYTYLPKDGNPVSVRAEGNLERAHTANFLNAIVKGALVSANLLAGLDACCPVQLALRAYWTKKTAMPEQLETPWKARDSS